MRDRPQICKQSFNGAPDRGWSPPAATRAEANRRRFSQPASQGKFARCCGSGDPRSGRGWSPPAATRAQPTTSLPATIPPLRSDVALCRRDGLEFRLQPARRPTFLAAKERLLRDGRVSALLDAPPPKGGTPYVWSADILSAARRYRTLSGKVSWAPMPWRRSADGTSAVPAPPTSILDSASTLP
jgi:hypothetical protein